ncbi:polyprenyl synthetase family protein [Pendulispora brunnea]|uniref:Polyprenyl synthetase family protein n=1 Tax=Pendulispora brunnea TaxID=2905690 RepID=A0ABZ2JYC7_9BACT
MTVEAWNGEARPQVHPRDVFAALTERVRASVDVRLAQMLEERTKVAAAYGEEAGIALEAARTLTTRGGKRTRAVLAAAAFEACGGGDSSVIAMAGVALELLQTHFLIHDDWMDDDDLRRGGPSVHAQLRARFGSTKTGDAMAILSGDYIAPLALEALLSVPLAPATVLEAARILAHMQQDAVVGQCLDMCPSGGRVEVVHDLKTGSYSVRGPLLLGAALAGGSADARAALVRYAAPLGIAFQLRDDLLGTFGDSRVTGKPVMSDIREGKRTALVDEVVKHPDAEPLLAKVLGIAEPDPRDLGALVQLMITSGARDRVERRLRDLLTKARRELVDAPFARAGALALDGAITALGDREK